MITIRRAQISDLPYMTKVYNQAIKHDIVRNAKRQVSIDHRTKWFLSHNQQTPVFMILLDNVQVGYMCIEPYVNSNNPDLSELQIFLEHIYKGMGIGYDALNLLIHEAFRIGYQTLVVRIKDNNYSAQNMLQKLNFMKLKAVPDLDGTHSSTTHLETWLLKR
ncbi:GNAT family N-acetyltransferase [Staphylococcus massiliensis]|uniref:Phosphinothricin N-acetyltransferase n=1 Tax=Staphylococcus massiliensis S46 TaxID=1229783 RepID=K9AIV5_9STAP|nr:GNAT family N-acetyltransferase [Staphylococcus massiliensis]EKU46006.1 phosphinothricin N-acetyltransferase [Staphylococcus massiliensis S46]MCG3400274.1 GNAT family N-acetyltransferase [Staphylococcus massiliensis]MCG3401904.1 GNAT family N-acetyltransferase [Staphylococcus massiliensis]MCG3412434.1 GNAT family N-acetyltransferase [Staphylococcus massiliensis]PNZ97576.1 GNAT family N-acetyltransferase [Staphylococcus massiliensis CCUG 55927]